VAYIGNDLQVAFSTYKNIDDISGSFDGVTTSFALLVNGVAPAPLPLNSNQCLISVGGVVQRPDDTGTEGFRLSGGNIVFSSAPNTAEDFFGVILAGADYVNAGANFPDGTLAAPSITFDQDNDTGYYRSGSGAVSFASNGVAAGTWSSAGVTAPALIPTGSSVPANGVYLPAANTVGVATNGVQRINIEADGDINIDGGGVFYDATNNRLAIGTTSPSTKLHVYDGAGGGASLLTQYDVLAVENDDTCVIQIISPTNKGGEIQFTDNSRSRGQIGYSHTDDALNFNTAGNERARIDSSGRLLVGTSSSSADATLVLMKHSGDANGPGILHLSNPNPAPGSGAGLGLIRFSNSQQNTFASIEAYADAASGGNDYPGRLSFSTTADGASSPTERMRIRSDGSMFFGTSSQPSASVAGIKLDVPGNNFWQSYNAGTSSYNQFVFGNGNGTVGSISTSGSATAYNTSSDYRLKENVTAVTDGITRLQQLKPSRFNFIADPDTVVDGFIAHEAQEVVPECITGEKDAVDDDGNPVYQGIDQSKLVPLLTAALQEAVAEIRALKDRVTALETP
jgi:hypothetical protein